MKAARMQDEEKWKDRGFAVVCMIGLWIVLAVCFDFYYDLNDDSAMKDILSGTYTGVPDGHNIQMLYPLGWGIAFLYRICPVIPWYGIFLCGCQFFVLEAVLCRLIRYEKEKRRRKSAWIRSEILLFLFLLGVFVLFLYEFVFLQYTVTAGLLVCGGLVWIFSGPKAGDAGFYRYHIMTVVWIILAFFLLLFGARGFSFRKLMKWYTIVIEILFMITVVASQTGYVENLIYDFEDRNIRISFGFTYPTIFAAHLFFLFLCLWYLAGDRWNLILAILSLLASCLVYIGSEARLSSICFLALAVILVLRKIKIRWMCKQGEHYKMNHIFARVLALTPIVCAFMMHMLSLLYSSDIKWMVQLNQLITNRLSLAKKGIEVYGFHLWGSSIPMIGMGGSVETRVNYFYLDSIYIQVSLIAGLVMLGIVLIVLFEAGYKAKASQEWILLWVLAFTGIHCLIEEHLLSIAVCPFLFAASTEVVRIMWRWL
jgi:hypothetical protein